MFRRIAVAGALVLTMAAVGGRGGSMPAPTQLSTAPAATQMAPAALQVTGNTLVVAPLSGAEMATVQGAGLWRAIKSLFKKVVKAIASVFVSAIETILDWFEDYTTDDCRDREDRMEADDTETRNYATQEDADNGGPYTSSTVTSSWRTTQTVYTDYCPRPCGIQLICDPV